VKIPVSLINDFGTLSAARAEFAPTEKLYQKALKELQEHYAASPADEVFMEIGTSFTLDISACGNANTVDKAAARKKLGAAVFFEFCSISQSALNQVLPKPEVLKLLITTQTGPRKFVPAPIAP
jgi:hypothetical protein